ncbi:hypothetical protein B834_2376 [Enterococcus mundtii 1A]|nr:hypothetical protein [Enterococcus mundtii 1A]
MKTVERKFSCFFVYIFEIAKIIVSILAKKIHGLEKNFFQGHVLY